MSDNGWTEWSRHILAELKRLNNCYETLREDVGSIKTEIAMLKVKSGIWGLIGGAIPVAIGLAIYFMTSGGN